MTSRRAAMQENLLRRRHLGILSVSGLLRTYIIYAVEFHHPDVIGKYFEGKTNKIRHKSDNSLSEEKISMIGSLLKCILICGHHHDRVNMILTIMIHQYPTVYFGTLKWIQYY